MLLGAPLSTWVIGAGLVFWASFLTFWIYKVSSHYSRLVGKSSKGDLREILEGILQNSDDYLKEVEKIKKDLGELGKKGEKSIQKVGLVRFNPFGDTGGNQSFALSLLDQTDTGIILLSLHGREGTRVYIKNITRGKSTYDLSKEEKRAIAEAK